MRRTSVLLSAVFCLISISASAKTIVVGACQRSVAATIQAGVNRAAPGDTVSVCPGNYAGGVVVSTRSLTLNTSGPKGAVKVVGIGVSGPPVGFTVVADNVRISGFDISGFSGTPNSFGILVGGVQPGDTGHPAHGASIVNNVIHGNGDGVYLWQSNGNRIYNNEIYNSLDLDGTEGVGILSLSGRLGKTLPPQFTLQVLPAFHLQLLV